MVSANGRTHPLSSVARVAVVRFSEAFRTRERDDAAQRDACEPAADPFAPAAVHARLAGQAERSAVRHLHACLAEAHEALRGSLHDADRVRAELASAVARAEALAAQEAEARQSERLAANSEIYADKERQRQEAARFWYSTHEAQEIASSFKTLQDDLRTGACVP